MDDLHFLPPSATAPYNCSTAPRRKKHRHILLLFLLCLLPFTSGCLDIFIAHVVGKTVTGAKHLVAPGDACNLNIDARNGRMESSGHSLPYFTKPEDVLITYDFDSLIRDFLMKEKVVWKRGRYQVVKQKRVDTRKYSFKSKFPWEKVSTDLGRNWYGQWEVCLFVNGHDIGCRDFYLIHPNEYQNLLQAIEQYRKQNRPEKVQEMQERAKRCNPLAWEAKKK